MNAIDVINLKFKKQRYLNNLKDPSLITQFNFDFILSYLQFSFHFMIITFYVWKLDSLSFLYTIQQIFIWKVQVITLFLKIILKAKNISTRKIHTIVKCWFATCPTTQLTAWAHNSNYRYLLLLNSEPLSKRSNKNFKLNQKFKLILFEVFSDANCLKKL